MFVVYFVCFLFCLDFIVCTGNNSVCALGAVELLYCVDVSVIIIIALSPGLPASLCLTHF